MMIVKVAEPIKNVDRRESKLATKNSNEGEKSRQNGSQIPYRPSPGVGSRRMGLQMSALRTAMHAVAGLERVENTTSILSLVS
jgi:hypothetical protein